MARRCRDRRPGHHGDQVGRDQVGLADLAGEDHVAQTERVDRFQEPLEYTLVAGGVAHEQEPALRLVVALEGGEGREEVLELLVRHHPTHEQNGGPGESGQPSEA